MSSLPVSFRSVPSDTEQATIVQDLRREYNAISLSYIQTVEIHAEKERENIETAINHLNTTRGWIIDLGCAAARDYDTWHKAGFQYLGIDISENLLAHARMRYRDGVFLAGDITKLTFQQESCAVVWASSVLQHVRKAVLPKLLENIYSGLVPGGILYANYRPPAESVAVEGIVESDEYRNNGAPYTTSRFIAHYTHEEMETYFRNANFKVITSESYNELYHLYNQEKTAYLPQKNIIFGIKY